MDTITTMGSLTVFLKRTNYIFTLIFQVEMGVFFTVFYKENETHNK